MSAFDDRDGGYTSRKLVLTVLTQVLMLGGAIVAGRWSAFGAQYPTLVGGLIAALGAYLGINTASKWVTGSNIVKLPDPMQHLQNLRDDASVEVKNDKVSQEIATSAPEEAPKSLKDLADEQDK